MASKLSADILLQLAKNRRTHYALSKNIGITNDRVLEIVRETTLHTPSSFNSQSNRLVVLFGAEHDKLWDITSDTLKAIVPEANWSATADRLSRFKAAAGTVLFFTDTSVIQNFATKFAVYADRFPVWGDQTNAIQQYLLWTALSAEGLGANLQHYNPLIDEKVAETWKIPTEWKLNAQLVFGGKEGEAGEKAYESLDERVKVFGA